ncbi:MAG: excinuclease ABC subunit UvrC [Eubacteriales bacterium]|nr:excinuclease ABC subunit UvrC [Eubacteriales bacterium]
MTEELKWKVANLPDSPGCYLMKSEGRVIYVGKAKNLKNRVKQYFQSSRGHSPKVRAMVARIDDFELVLADTELEALVLEANLIKKHAPFYNILLKDDKHYPFIAIDPSKPFPAPELRRKREKDGARYFGPYTGTTTLYEVLDAVRAEFPLRTCTRQINPEKPTRPCIHHQIGRCLAPCAGKVTAQEYQKVVEGAIAFLSGDARAVLSGLEQKMREAAMELNYEKAAVYRDRMQAVRQVLEKQKADGRLTSDQDVLAVLYEGEDALVQLMNVREGKLIGSEHFVLDRAADEAEGSILLSFILQYYGSDRIPPRELLLSALPEEADTLAQLLSDLSPGRAKVRIHTPQRGEKHHLMELAYKNLREAAVKRKKKLESSFMRTEGALIELTDVLGLSEPPHRIEGFDISNTQGAQSVASMVVMIDGLAANREYRHFRIKTVQGANDFASMRETLLRRLSHGLREIEERRAQGLPPEGGSFSTLPDLILIDGGHGQLHEAQEAMHSLGLDIPMFGLAERIEEIVLPGREDTILLPRTSPALHLIQRLRDEAHRFAITHHRKLRGKRSVSSQLDDIPGVGPKRKKALLTHFKTMEELKNADAAALSAVEGVDKRTAEAVYAYFHPQTD